jgi:hypothetical protein
VVTQLDRQIRSFGREESMEQGDGYGRECAEACAGPLQVRILHLLSELG